MGVCMQNKSTRVCAVSQSGPVGGSSVKGSFLSGRDAVTGAVRERSFFCGKGYGCRRSLAGGFTLFATTFFGMMAAAAAPAWALGGETMGSVIQNTVESSEDMPNLLSAFAYLFGIVLGALAIGKLIEHVQSPQQVSVWEPLKRFFAGGAFFALPTVMDAAYNTLVGTGDSEVDSIGYGAWNTSGLSEGGLDAMVVRFVGNIFEPMHYLLSAFGYLAGIVLIMIGISRMLKSAQDGPRGPGGLGTIMTFIVAGALFSFDRLMRAWTYTMFDGNGNQLMTYAELAYDSGMDDAVMGHANAVISGLIAFVAILGWVSFIRGWFIIRDVAEGNQQASMMAGITHLFAGALAVNLGAVINVVQTTLDIADYGVNFSPTGSARPP